MKNRAGVTDDLRRIFPYLKQFKIHFFSLIVCFAITAISTFAQPLVIRKITDDGFVQKDLNVIIYFALIILLLCSLIYVFDLLQNRIFVGIHNKLADTMYNKAFSKLLRLPISYYSDSNSNEIVHKLSTDIDYLTMFAGPPPISFCNECIAYNRRITGFIANRLEINNLNCYYDTN